MKRYFYGDFVFDEDYKCEVVETWEYNNKSKNDKWELIEILPITEGFQDSYFEENKNINPDSDCYIFCEISEQQFKEIKEGLRNDIN